MTASMGTGENWTPEIIHKMFFDYQKLATLHAALKLEIFTHLSSGGMSCVTAPSKLGLSERGGMRFLKSLVALGFLVEDKDRDKDKNCFTNSSFAEKYLNSHSPEYLGYIFLHHAHISSQWQMLDQSVKTGKSVCQIKGIPSKEIDTDTKRLESFLMGMWNLGNMRAHDVVKVLAKDLLQKKTVLDLGGGPGAYILHFFKHFPHLTSGTLFDLPTTKKFAESKIGEWKMENKVQFISGDYLNIPQHSDLKDRQYDVIWASHILHQQGDDECQKVIHDCKKLLNDDGILFIQEFLLDEGESSPLRAALFSLNMLVGTDNGKSYSEVELRKILIKSGFKKIDRVTLPSTFEAGILRAQV